MDNDKNLTPLESKVRAQGLAIKMLVQVLEARQPGLRRLLRAAVPSNDQFPREQEILMDLFGDPK